VTADGGGDMNALDDGVCGLLRDAFEDAPFEFWARDLTGRCIVANAATRALGGVDVGNFVEDGKVPPEVIAAWQANNRRAYAGEVVKNVFEYGEGDQRRYLECYIVPLRVGGTISGILGFNIDVTGHRRTEDALRISERRLREALRVGRMGWMDWDLVTNKIRWSPETFRLFGHEPGAITPTVEGTINMFLPEETDYLAKRLKAVIHDNEPYDIVHRMVRRDGEVIHVHGLAEVERDSDGKALRMLGTVVDITERKRVEEELRAVDRRRSEFLGVLSHELRNPLAVIGSAVHCIDQAALEDEQVRRALAVIGRQTRHLSRLVDDLLDITRVRSGKIDLRRTTIDLAELVRTTVEDHRDQLAGHTVAVEISPDVRASTHGDPTRLAQILSNLLSNAAKFTPTGGAITISLAVVGGRAVIEVTDTGVGIDEESLRQLFVPFVQADRTFERSRQGLGLGLALTKTLVELHGGEVRAASAGPGQGATFTVMLPLVEAEPALSRPPASKEAKPRNVLIIEDDEDAAEWLSIALSFHGHRLTIALDGATGIAKARELAPDVILCDIGLPGGLDGYAVARTLQQDAALGSTYRVALSGFTQPEDQARARAAGFDAHISKPPDVDALARMLAELPKR
jgi:PAS domain S-box-containing protein